MLFMPRMLLLKAVAVEEGLSRAQGVLAKLGSVRPRIWRVSRREGREIWKVGVVERSSVSVSVSESGWACCGEGARKV
jgi:hypothetical protein